MRLRLLSLLMTVLTLVLPAAAQESDSETTQDEQTLRAANLPTDGPALLEFFRKRSVNQTDPAVAADLVRRLGDRSAAVSDRAIAELVSLGPSVTMPLRVAAKDVDDPELSGRARRCLELIESDQAAALPSAAARLVAARRPARAAEVLLAYLPYADDETVVEEVRNALVRVAISEQKPDAVLVQALSDKVALKRAVAAEALSTIRTPEVQTALQKLLDDPRSVVQLRAALALANTARDPKAVSTLIASLANVPLPQARLAEEFLQNLAGEQAPKVALGDDTASRELARDEWAKWWLDSEKPALLEELTRRTLTNDLRAKALTLIQQLGDDDFDVREKATAELQGLGQAMLSMLRQNLNHPDVEVRARVLSILGTLEKDKAVPLSPVVPRLVALRKPLGAAAALLGYLPFAEDLALQDEVLSALIAVAVREGVADPALVKALQDTLPIRRAAAAEALWLSGDESMRPTVRKLLLDADPYVRMRVAVAMARTREIEAVPVVIASLFDLPPEQSRHAEEYLLWIAGDRGPQATVAADVASRTKARDEWLKWWDTHRATIDLAPSPTLLASRHLGYTLLVFLETGRVVEVGRDGKPRWEMAGFNYPYDAQMVANDRVLVAENSGGRVLERTIKGDIIWQKAIHNTVNCQRLANGNTFIATRNQLVEVDKNGKDVFVYNRPQGDINAARKTRDGQIMMATTTGSLIRMDAKASKELKSVVVGQITVGGMEVLPNGRLLLAHYNNAKVVEYDLEGRVVWQATVNSPTSAFRLPNGNTLVSTGRNNSVVEIDRTGKTISEQRHPQRVWKIRQR